MNVAESNRQDLVNDGWNRLIAMMLYYAYVEHDTEWLNSDYGKEVRHLYGCGCDDVTEEHDRVRYADSKADKIIAMLKDGMAPSTVTRALGVTAQYVSWIRSTRTDIPKYRKKKVYKMYTLTQEIVYSKAQSREAVDYMDKIKKKMPIAERQLLDKNIADLLEVACMYGYEQGAEEAKDILWKKVEEERKKMKKNENNC